MVSFDLYNMAFNSSLFNLFFNDFFFCILIVSAHNFAHDDNLSSFAVPIKDC